VKNQSNINIDKMDERAEPYPTPTLALKKGGIKLL